MNNGGIKACLLREKKARPRAYTGRLFRKGTSEGRGVILSAAKDLSPGTTQIQSSREDACPQRSEGMTGILSKCLVYDAYHLQRTGTSPAPIIAPSRSAGSSPAGACLAYQRPELDRDLAPAGFVSAGCPAGTSALPATVSQRPRWCATCLP